MQAIQQEGVTNSFGSPTLWRKIAVYCHREKIVLPGLKRVLCAGAPVSPDLWNLMPAILSGGQLHSPYGATEALPVSSVSDEEIHGGLAAATARGAGTCVGRVIAPNEVRIIALTDAPLTRFDEATALPPGEIGEIIVRGPTVTLTYDGLPDATARAKIADGGWHRMGDCGYFDAAGRLWFCGRAVERVVLPTAVLFTEQVEPIFNAHSEVRRTALIGLTANGCTRPALVVEPRYAEVVKTSEAYRLLGRELHAIAMQHLPTAEIKTYFFHKNFPVDVRHNAKIHRLELARWAGTATGFEIDPKR